jgi:hypothetical protein
VPDKGGALIPCDSEPVTQADTLMSRQLKTSALPSNSTSESDKGLALHPSNPKGKGKYHKCM